MNTIESISGKKVKSWTLAQKIAFRFFFIFISFYTWFGNNVLRHIFYPRFGKLIGHVSILKQPLYWLDKHFYHIGYNPGKSPDIGLMDSPLTWVTLITILWISVAGCIAWSIADRNRGNYNKLNYWFNTYLAYYLFIIMDFYAIYKIMVVQMPFPNAEYLLKPLGNYSRLPLFFNLVGLSPGYSIFTGACELIAALLVLSRRTRVSGCLFMTAILVNILCFNLFYNVLVKVLIINLLLITLYLLAPYVFKLVQFFYLQQPVSLAEKQYTFSTPWKKYAVKALLLIPILLTFNLVLRSIKLLKQDEMRQQQKVYNVTNFVKGADTLQPLLTDTFRIKRLIFTAYSGRQYAVVYNMTDSAIYYRYTWDTKNKKITMTDKRDTLAKAQLHYKELPANGLELDGKWKGHDVNILLKKMEIDSLPLVKEKISWGLKD